MSTLFMLLPILGGGIFMALTDTVTGQVRIYPNLPVFGVVLGLLVLYLGGLLAMVPYRHGIRLPHGITCLAELVGFLMNTELVREELFKNVRSRDELVGRLIAGEERGERWGFGVGGRGEEEMLGVRRVRRVRRLRSLEGGG